MFECYNLDIISLFYHVSNFVGIWCDGKVFLDRTQSMLQYVSAGIIQRAVKAYLLWGGVDD
jgi:hypothetical protein